MLMGHVEAGGASLYQIERESSVSYAASQEGESKVLGAAEKRPELREAFGIPGKFREALKP